jgi:hypothetical protein
MSWKSSVQVGDLVMPRHIDRPIRLGMIISFEKPMFDSADITHRVVRVLWKDNSSSVESVLALKVIKGE